MGGIGQVTGVRIVVALLWCGLLVGCANQAATPSPQPTPSDTAAPSLTPRPTPAGSASPRPTASDLARYGEWALLPQDSPISPIHAALLHTGRVWFGTGSNNEAAHFAARDFRSGTWDPADGTFHEVATPWDVFCAGHSFLADGRLLLTGGTIGYPEGDIYYKGSRRAYLFDPMTEEYDRVSDMADGRWYPSNVTLPTGRVYVIAGMSQNGIDQTVVPEIFDPQGEGFVEAPGNAVWPQYPALFVTTRRGQLFFSGGQFVGIEGIEAGFLDIATGTLTKVGGPSEPQQREQSASVLLPPAQDQRVMIMGGGGKNRIATANVDIIDLNAAAPVYVAGPPLSAPRVHVNAVLLPDRTVLATGGGRVGEDQAVHSAEIFDPQTESWRTVAEAGVDRLYHSFALLLPDGRVLVGGSNPVEGSHEHRLEIYSPPYLFAGPRPVIAAAPESATYGELITVQATSAQHIAQMSLMRPSAVTHSLDTEQRLVDLPFTNQGDVFELHLPNDPTIAPPGWYMLFAVNDTGVPSVAAWIRLDAQSG